MAQKPWSMYWSASQQETDGTLNLDNLRRVYYEGLIPKVYVDYGELQGTEQEFELAAAELSPEKTRGGNATIA